MTATLTPLSAADVQARLKSGRARLVDIREPDEFAREHIPGVAHAPLSGFEDAHLGIRADQDVIFMCRSGMRTQTNCVRLAARVEGEAFVLEGGLQGWKDAGLPTSVDRKAPTRLSTAARRPCGTVPPAQIARAAPSTASWPSALRCCGAHACRCAGSPPERAAAGGAGRGAPKCRSHGGNGLH